MLICSILTATGSNFEDEIKAKGRICFKSVVTDQECGFNFTKKKKNWLCYTYFYSKTSIELIGILYKLTWTINLKFSLVNGGRKFSLP